MSAGAESYDAAVAEEPKKPSNSKKMSTNGVRKGAARRGRPKKNWGEEFVTTNAKSPLVNVDLVVCPHFELLCQLPLEWP